MTVSTLRPDGVVTAPSVGASVIGAASLDAALSDNSDASSLQLVDTPPSGTVSSGGRVSFQDLSLPAGAVIEGLALRIRDNLNAGPGEPVWFGGDPLGLLIGLYRSGDLTPFLNGNHLPGWSAPSTITCIAFNTGPWTDAQIDGMSVDLGMRGTNNGTVYRIFEVYLDVTYVAQPVLTGVTGPTGTITSNKPTVAWTDGALDSDGGARTNFEMKIFSAAQYGAGGFDPSVSTPTYTSGLQSGAATLWPVTVPLPNATYRAYVRIAQTVNGAPFYSAWGFSTFTVNSPTPPQGGFQRGQDYDVAAGALRNFDWRYRTGYTDFGADGDKTLRRSLIDGLGNVSRILYDERNQQLTYADEALALGATRTERWFQKSGRARMFSVELRGSGDAEIHRLTHHIQRLRPPLNDSR